MRLRSDITRITYAGRDILAPGGYLAADSYGGSRAFTTAAEPLLEAASPAVRAYGNAQGSMNVPVCKDYPSEEDAIKAAFAAIKHAENHQEGELVFSVGEQTLRWAAGITGLQWRLNYTWCNTETSVGSVRLTLTYDFILGAELQE